MDQKAIKIEKDKIYYYFHEFTSSDFAGTKSPNFVFAKMVGVRAEESLFPSFKVLFYFETGAPSENEKFKEDRNFSFNEFTGGNNSKATTRIYSLEHPELKEVMRRSIKRIFQIS